MIPKGYEQVTEIPAPKRAGRGTNLLILEPGQIIRRPLAGASTFYNANFKRRNTPDYHAVQRTVDGVRYLYIWRDPVEETA